MSEQTRTVPTKERRLDAARLLALNPDDNIAWLTYMRDVAAADRDDAFAEEDKISANAHADVADRFFRVIEELRRLRDRMAAAERMLADRQVYVDTGR